MHYAGYGSNLKRRLEKRVCGKGGWRGGGLPCHGKAIFKSGFPAVFSTAMSGGGLSHVRGSGAKREVDFNGFQLIFRSFRVI